MDVFSTINLETTISILDAIERLGLPNFVQIASTNVQLSGYDCIYEIVKCHTDKMNVPISLHLDHGKTQGDVRQVMYMDSTSVTTDGVALSSEENIAFAQKVVGFCKSYGVPVGVELGAILGKEDDHASEADCKMKPEEVKIFVERIGCDMLATSIGNAHDSDDIPRIDIPLPKCIAEADPVPLVVHGGSGIVPGILRSFVNYRVAKVNTASGLRKVFIIAVGKAHVSNHNEANLARVMASAKSAIEEGVYSKVLMMNEGHRLDK